MCAGGGGGGSGGSGRDGGGGDRADPKLAERAADETWSPAWHLSAHARTAALRIGSDGIASRLGSKVERGRSCS